MESQVIDTTTLKLPDEIVAHASELCRVADAAVILNQKDLAASASVVSQINAHIAKVDADKETVARPLREALDNFYKLWHGARDPLEAAKKRIVGLQKDYQRRVEEEQRREAERLKAEAEARALKEAEEAERNAELLKAKALETEDPAEAQELLQQAVQETAKANDALAEAAELPLAPVEAPKGAKGAYGSVSYRSDWKWRLAKEGDLSLVPTQYLQVNEKLINANVKAGVRTIAGLVIYEDKTPINRK